VGEGDSSCGCGDHGSHHKKREMERNGKEKKRKRNGMRKEEKKKRNEKRKGMK
jgi:hypothetical protein